VPKPDQASGSRAVNAAGIASGPLGARPATIAALNPKPDTLTGGNFRRRQEGGHRHAKI